MAEKDAQDASSPVNETTIRLDDWADGQHRRAVVEGGNFHHPPRIDGSGCVAPRLSNEIFEACQRGAYNEAGALRTEFLPLEDLRDAWGPSKVLHFATALAGLADTGPILPYFSPLPVAQMEQLQEVARTLAAANSLAAQSA